MSAIRSSELSIGRLGQAALVEVRIARPECDQVFRGFDVLAEIAIRREAPDVGVGVNDHGGVLTVADGDPLNAE